MELRRCVDNTDPIESLDADENCLNVLSEQYSFVRVIAHGAYGTVLELKHNFATEMSIAVKIIALYNDETYQLESNVRRELDVACKIDRELAPVYEAFARTYGWLVCNSVPELWRHAIVKHYIGTYRPLPDYGDGAVYIFSEKYWVSFGRYTFESVRQCKAILFEILATVIQANKTTGFAHNDLHVENVLLHNAGRPAQPITVEGGATFRLDSTVRPKIID